MSSKVTVGIRIKADGTSQFVANNKASQKALDRTRRSALRANKGVLSFSATVDRASGLLRTFVGIGIATAFVAGIKGVAEQADQYRILEARIRVATLSTGDYNSVSARVFAISQKNGTSLKETIKLFQNLARVAPELDANNDQMLDLLDLVQKVGITSGASFVDMKFAMRQFAQSMASGIVRAEEFNSIVENTPELAFQIAKGMGLTLGQLRLAVIEGRVLSTEVFDAINKQGREINLIFRGFPRSIEQAKTALDAGFGRSISKLNEELAFGTDEFADTLDNAAKSLASFAEDDDAIAGLARDMEQAVKWGKIAVETFLVFKASGLIVGGFNALNVRLALTRAELSGVSAEALRAAGALNSASSINVTSNTILASRNKAKRDSLGVVTGSASAVKKVSNLTTALYGLKAAGTGALAVLGGWPGLLIAGGIAAASYAVSASDAADETEDYSRTLLELEGRVQALSLRNLTKKLEDYQAKLAEVQAEADGFSRRRFGRSAGVGAESRARQLVEAEQEINAITKIKQAYEQEIAAINLATEELAKALDLDSDTQYSQAYIEQLTKIKQAQDAVGKSKQEQALNAVDSSRVSKEEAIGLKDEINLIYSAIEAHKKKTDAEKQADQQRKQTQQQAVQFSAALDRQVATIKQSIVALTLNGRALDQHNALLAAGVNNTQQLTAADERRKQAIVSATNALYDQRRAINQLNAGLDLELHKMGEVESLRKSLRTSGEVEAEAHAARIKLIFQSVEDGYLLESNAAALLSKENARHLEALGKIGDKGTELSTTFDGLKASIEGWGASFADTMLDSTGSFNDFAENVLRQLAKIAIQNLSQPLFSLFGDSIGGLFSSGGSSAATTFDFSSGVDAGSLFSFDGGGSTGYGPRTGGVDGKGGFPAILHPNETVIDHTKSQSSSSSAGTSIVQYFTIDARNATPGVEDKIRAAVEEGSMKGYQLVLNDMKRNGAIRQAIS